MTDLKTVTIPDADDLMHRLRQAGGSLPGLDAFYQDLQQYAGRKLTGEGIAVGLTLAAIEYASPYPAGVTASTTACLHLFVPAFTDDPETQARALDHLKAAGLPDGR